jgi:hypothetical protein
MLADAYKALQRGYPGEKEARSQSMAKKAYSCGISKIDLRGLRFSKVINNVNICLPHDECYSN